VVAEASCQPREEFASSSKAAVSRLLPQPGGFEGVGAGGATGSDERNLGGLVPATPIHHVDLAVADVERSLAFYRALLGPLGWTKELRYPTYRGTEEVVYLQEPTTRTGLGLRPADEGEYRYYSVGIEHLAFEVDERDEVDAAYERCLARGARIHFPPEEDRDEY
jgi:catechol 2,3-dioxygenase-like lactoylglutathione lyase family enzyme